MVTTASIVCYPKQNKQNIIQTQLRKIQQLAHQNITSIMSTFYRTFRSHTRAYDPTSEEGSKVLSKTNNYRFGNLQTMLKFDTLTSDRIQQRTLLSSD